MKTLLIILFSLILIIQTHNLRILDNSYVEKENCPNEWKKKTEKQCSYPDGTKIDASTKENCISKSTMCCSNLNYSTKKECEKSKWIKGKCYKKITDSDDYFLSNYTDKESCEEKKADWTMQYCSFHTFEGKIYDEVKKGDDVYNQTEHFKTICSDILGGDYQVLNGDNCYFEEGNKLNKYFCSILYDNIGLDEECSTMESEQCAKLGGTEYGECSYDNLFGEFKEKCIAMNQNEWRTGENESFCLGDSTILTEDLCLAKYNYTCQKMYGNWTPELGECSVSEKVNKTDVDHLISNDNATDKSNDSATGKSNDNTTVINNSSKQYLSLKIIFAMFGFIFIVL